MVGGSADFIFMGAGIFLNILLFRVRVVELHPSLAFLGRLDGSTPPVLKAPRGKPLHALSMPGIACLFARERETYCPRRRNLGSSQT